MRVPEIKHVLFFSGFLSYYVIGAAMFKLNVGAARMWSGLRGRLSLRRRRMPASAIASEPMPGMPEAAAAPDDRETIRFD
jgi:hypothetical protein